MQSLLHDLRYAFRESLRRPGLNLLAVLTLALGIGAVTMMYSVIYNVLLNPFPYTDPRRMVDIIIRNANDGSIRGALTIPEFRAFVDESGVFEEAVGTDLTQRLYRSENGVEQLSVAALTPNSFRFLGVSALLGRTIGDPDAAAGAPPVAVVSHKAWITYFGGDPGVLGRTLVLDDRPMTIVGVMPPRFTWHVADVWIPDPAERGDPAGMKKGFWLQARLKKGLSLSQAEAELNMIGSRLAQLYPDRYPKRFKITVITVIDWVVGKFRWVLYTLFGAVGLLLLIACCNVANMLLARATTREKELAIRSALGATRFRILQQTFVESLLLALGGGVLGIILAYAGLRALKQFIPPYTIPVETEIGINPSVLLFSLAVAMFTAVLFGVAPALQSTRRDVALGLSASGKGNDLGTRHGGLRRVLVVCEVTLSLVLLSGAAVLMQSFLTLVNQDMGFNPQNFLATRMDLPKATPAAKRQFFDAALQRLTALPGVTSAGISSGVPPYGGGGTDIDVPGKPHAEPWSGQFELCNDTYFQAVGFRFVSGSAFAPGDVATGRRVAVINETLRKRYFGNEDPLGKQIRLARLASVPGGVADPTFVIMGVVHDVRNRGLEEPVAPQAFIPYTVTGLGFPRILIRTSQDPHALLNALRREIRAVNGNIVQRDPMIIDETLAERSYARPRFSVLLMGVFGTLGLLLVATGVYGVMAYVVSRQTREIGIRMALGAQRSQVFRAVFGGAFRLIGIGALLGAGASVATNRIIANQVWTVRMFDPVALGGAVALIAILGGVACFQPAFRATRVDPNLALRQD
jgi:putative ABC transport system permease protein